MSAMPGYDFRSPRLYVERHCCRSGAAVALDRAQAHYLTDVLRLKSGDRVLVFNGRDGEWSATIEVAQARRRCSGSARKTRQQTAAGDLHYLFAPLKAARLDYMVQKAVEMGVVAAAAGAHPPRPGRARQSRAHARQRHRSRRAMRHSRLPEIAEPRRADAPPRRMRVAAAGWCSAMRMPRSPIRSPRSPRCRGARRLRSWSGRKAASPKTSARRLLKLPNVVRLSLGPRILRADTAAVAALALVQAVIGDWR